MTMLWACSVPALFLFQPVHDCVHHPLGSVSICWFASWTGQCVNGHRLPQLREPSCLPLSGAPNTCEMVLSRGLGTHRRRVLLGRTYCSQLELRLHTVIFTPKSQKELATTGLGRPVFLKHARLTQHDLQRAPLWPLGRGSFSWCRLWWVSLGNRGGVGLPASRFGKRVCSQQPGNWKHWSQPTSSGHPGFSPRRWGEMMPATGWTDHWKGWCGCTLRSEEKLDLPGNRNVVASDLYVTFVYNGIFFK